MSTACSSARRVAGDGWLTYFYQPEDFTKSWNKVRGFAEEAGQGPDELLNANQLPIMSAPRATRCERR